MNHNFFLDNPDLISNFDDELHLKTLEILGEIAACELYPSATIVDQEGPRFDNGKVYYHPLTVKAFELLKKSGLTGMTIPEMYGGLELPMSVFLASIEIISRADAGLAALWSLQACADTICNFASDELKDYWLPRLANGATAAMALTEPDAGSDLQSVRTEAVYDGVSWRLNGVKRFITNGNASMVLVLARSEKGTSDARGLSLFAYDSNDGGVVYRRLEKKMGIRSSTTLEMVFNNAPAKLVGDTRLGLIKYVMALMNGARLAVAAQSVGIAESAYREALNYAYSRMQFGNPVASLPQVNMMLHSISERIRAMRALLYKTGEYVDGSKSAEREKKKRFKLLSDAFTPLVKFISSEQVNRIVYDSLQIHGGVGYMLGTRIEMLYRDARVTSIYEGTSQMQVIAVMASIQKGIYLDEILRYESEIENVPKTLVTMREMYKKALDIDAPKDIISRTLVEMTAYIVMSYLYVMKHGVNSNFLLELECQISSGLLFVQKSISI